jgi:hypothetical protein
MRREDVRYIYDSNCGVVPGSSLRTRVQELRFKESTKTIQ